VHEAFNRPDRSAVDHVHAAALAADAQIRHPPRLWPDYDPTYHAVFVRDLDGNTVDAASRT